MIGRKIHLGAVSADSVRLYVKTYLKRVKIVAITTAII